MEDDQQAMELGTASEKMDAFLRVFIDTSGMELTYVVSEGHAADANRLLVTFAGADTKLLVARNAELLRAMESIATGILRLEPEHHDQISFDAEGYKARRAEQMRQSAEIAIASVRSTGRPYTFPPMNSRERRMLHLELTGSGLRSASSGEPSRRFVVLYPAQQSSGTPGRGSDDRTKVIRNAFRPR